MELTPSDPDAFPVRGPGLSEGPMVFPDYGNASGSGRIPADTLRWIATMVCGDTVEATKLMHAIVPKTSLNRRGALTVPQTETAQRVFRLFMLAQDAFGEEADARAFMRKPHPELDNRRPIDAAMTELGGRAVERILDSLLYGLPV